MNQIIFPTASTVACFLNGIHIDQAYGFNYKDSVPKVPIYGYNDYEFSKVVMGKRSVQGVLVINFVFPGYLSAVLNRRESTFVPKLYNYDLVKDDSSLSAQYGDNIVNRIETELPSNTSAENRAARADFISSLIAKDRINKTKVRASLENFFKRKTKELHQPREPYPDPLTIRTSSENGNILDVYYTDPQLATWFIRFNHTEFTETSQQISQAGAEGSSEPLYLIHQFIAKNVEIHNLIPLSAVQTEGPLP